MLGSILYTLLYYAATVYGFVHPRVYETFRVHGFFI